jgi:hypothetical protein
MNEVGQYARSGLSAGSGKKLGNEICGAPYEEEAAGVSEVTLYWGIL